MSQATQTEPPFNKEPSALIPPGKSVILFDGVCNMCNGFVNFVIDHDSDQRFVFCSLQSSTGVQILHHYSMPQDLSTMVLIDNNQVYTHSTGVLKVLSQLDGSYQYLGICLYMPEFVRNLGYKTVAHLRYTVFGQSDRCRICTPALRPRFLDWNEPKAPVGGVNVNVEKDD